MSIMAHHDELPGISFDTLISYHKQEATEELTYITILFTVIVGIIGYLGTASKVERSSRILILLFYSGLHYMLMGSLAGSLKIHSALHNEISLFVRHHSEIFILGRRSELYHAIHHLREFEITDLNIIGYTLLAFMIICILGIGDNSILDWKKLKKGVLILKRKSS